MSRIGKKPIIIGSGVNLLLSSGLISISGKKGNLTIRIPQGVTLERKENQLFVKAAGKNSSLQGLVRSLIQNGLYGVENTWQKTLELVGVGFRAKVENNQLILSLGFSHPVKITAPAGISFQVVENNKIIVSGVDKYLVGEIAAKIRHVKPPEPYKGKGIRYLGEKVRKKLGKAVKTAGPSGGAGGKQ